MLNNLPQYILVVSDLSHSVVGFQCTYWILNNENNVVPKYIYHTYRKYITHILKPTTKICAHDNCLRIVQFEES